MSHYGITKVVAEKVAVLVASFKSLQMILEANGNGRVTTAAIRAPTMFGFGDEVAHLRVPSDFSSRRWKQSIEQGRATIVSGD